MSLINDALVQAGKETAAMSSPAPGIVFRGSSGLHLRPPARYDYRRLILFASLLVFLGSLTLGVFWLRANANRYHLPGFVRNLLVPNQPAPKNPLKVKARTSPSPAPTPLLATYNPPQVEESKVVHEPPPQEAPKKGFMPKMMEMFSNISVKSITGRGDEEEFKLQGIVYCPGNSSVMINGQMAFVGEKIANAKVRSIGPGSVVLLCGTGRTNVLELHP